MNNSSLLRNAAKIGLPLAAVATIILAIVYVQEQQTLRELANEPQEYVARDAALRVIAAGALPTGGFASAIPIEQDPAVYLIFYDATGTPVAGTGMLGGQPPQIPLGVLTIARARGVNRVTWQPQSGVRQALVAVPAGDGYVVVGRSLAYTEEKEQQLLTRSIMGWVATMLGIAIVALFAAWLGRRRSDR